MDCCDYCSSTEPPLPSALSDGNHSEDSEDDEDDSTSALIDSPQLETDQHSILSPERRAGPYLSKARTKLESWRIHARRTHYPHASLLASNVLPDVNLRTIASRRRGVKTVDQLRAVLKPPWPHLDRFGADVLLVMKDVDQEEDGRRRERAAQVEEERREAADERERIRREREAESTRKKMEAERLRKEKKAMQDLVRMRKKEKKDEERARKKAEKTSKSSKKSKRRSPTPALQEDLSAHGVIPRTPTRKRTLSTYSGVLTTPQKRICLSPSARGTGGSPLSRDVVNTPTRSRFRPHEGMLGDP